MPPSLSQRRTLKPLVYCSPIMVVEITSVVRRSMSMPVNFSQSRQGCGPSLVAASLSGPQDSVVPQIAFHFGWCDMVFLGPAAGALNLGTLKYSLSPRFCSSADHIGWDILKLDMIIKTMVPNKSSDANSFSVFHSLVRMPLLQLLCRLRSCRVT
jgi:hypothetical protein